jgi:hypothetical protein
MEVSAQLHAPATLPPRKEPPVKVKVKSLCFFNWAPRHGGILGEWRYSATHSLTSALDGGEWSASHPGPFTPRRRAPKSSRYPVLRACLEEVAKIKNPSLPLFGIKRNDYSFVFQFVSYATFAVVFVGSAYRWQWNPAVVRDSDSKFRSLAPAKHRKLLFQWNVRFPIWIWIADC